MTAPKTAPFTIALIRSQIERKGMRLFKYSDIDFPHRNQGVTPSRARFGKSFVTACCYSTLFSCCLPLDNHYPQLPYRKVNIYFTVDFSQTVDTVRPVDWGESPNFYYQLYGRKVKRNMFCAPSWPGFESRNVTRWCRPPPAMLFEPLRTLSLKTGSKTTDGLSK